MSQKMIDDVNIQLYDLIDQTKAELSELNQNKQLVINGPDSQLIQRGLDISYLQGQKQAIDTISSLIEQHPSERDFLEKYTEYAQKTSQAFEKSNLEFKMMSIPTQDFNVFLGQHYRLKGIQTVIASINSTVKKYY
ncbi:hypothetical protein OWI77_03170 [Staphylococcus nepalensis]|uniref:hypothetical protein n=1 Tax=Staphylococcus nepalensis TaxID=214473 RepID=UPI002271D4DD|nr:hypothetical protein [Staphylococcus nepalensis]MCY1037822.1 hypothetical protein [Staphylococcus nepalensis]